MKIWAHRGCSYAWPENTLQAFEAACKYNITGIELDIQLTKDNKMVVIHDETVDRTTNGTGKVKDFTLAEIKKLKIATHPGFLGIKKYTQIPTIEEVFDLLKPHCQKKGLLINIELKNSRERYDGMEDMILALVKEQGLEKNIVYSSFNPDFFVTKSGAETRTKFSSSANIFSNVSLINLIAICVSNKSSFFITTQ